MKIKKIITMGLATSALVTSLGFTSFASELSETEIPAAIQNEDAKVNGEVLIGLKPTSSRSATYEVTGNGVRLRNKPSLSATILGTLNQGDLVNTSNSADTVSADGIEWLSVYSYKHGTWGWVAYKYIIQIG